MSKINEANLTKESEIPKGPTNTIMGTEGLSARIHHSELSEKDKLKVITHANVTKMTGITRNVKLEMELKDK